MSATTRPTIGHNDQTPPNQCWTAEYQSSVVGKKMKPRIGHSTVLNMPWNQLVKNQRIAMTMRGKIMAMKPIKQHGMI
jgi:hypothetical protein